MRLQITEHTAESSTLASTPPVLRLVNTGDSSPYNITEDMDLYQADDYYFR